MASTSKTYRDAAVGYLVYGLIYLIGAVYLARVGASPRAMAPGSTWWFVLGGLMVVVLPLLIWKEFKWLTRALAVLVLVRVVGLLRLMIRSDWEAVPLPWGGAMSEAYGAAAFLAVSLVVCMLLARAGWSTWLERRRGSGEPETAGAGSRVPGTEVAEEG